MANVTTRMKIAAAAVLVLILTAYAVPASSAGSLRTELESLRAELEATRAELDGYRYAPDRLVAQVEDALAGEAMDSAEYYLGLLVRYHPQTEERTAAEKSVSETVARIEAEKKAAAEKAERERREAAEKRLAEERARKEREARSLRAMKKREDDMRGINFYQDPASPQYINSRSTLYYYIAHTPGRQPTLRAKLIYKGDNWVFFRTAYAKIGDEVFRFHFSHFDVERDNGYSGVWEWVDVVATGDWLRLANRLADSGGSVRLRFEGDQYYREVTMSAADARAVGRVLEAYRYLEQNPNTR